MNKKGMDISLNFIILAVLALIALIIVALFFTGGLTSLFEETEDVGDVTGEELALAEAECITYCSVSSESSWDNPGFTDSVDTFLKKGEGESANCEDLTGNKFENCAE